jgi:flavin-dependent dehydrogenase
VAAGALLLAPTGLEAIARTAEGWQVKLTDQNPISARVVVDAAGRGSPLATGLGVGRRRLDELVALAAMAMPAPDGGLVGQSLVEPFAHGWWYAAPLPDGRAILTLMTDSDLVRELGLTEPGAFHGAWAATDELRRLVPPPGKPMTPAVFAAHSSVIDRAAGPGWLAVGDALIGFDPLTSSGMAGALDDALAAADTIAAWLSGAPPEDAGRAYGRRADSTFKRYMADRSRIYGLERRWPDSKFWLRRQKVPALAGAGSL